MDLYDNPFYILDATPRDNRQGIYELADEQCLLSDPDICSNARSDLTNPRKRIAAEVAWLPGVGPSRASEAFSQLERDPELLRNAAEFPPLAKANLYAAAISRLGEKISADDLAAWIFELATAYEDIDVENVLVLINEDRSLAGFPQITDLSLIESELSERRSHYRSSIKQALNLLPSNDLIDAVTFAIEEGTDLGETHAPILIDDVVDLYEVEAQGVLEREARNIKTLIQTIHDAAEAEATANKIADMVKELESLVRHWDTIAQPIQISAMSRGMDHAMSHEVAAHIRELALMLHNEYGMLKMSQWLTKLSQEVFAEVVEVAAWAEEDAIVLEELAEQQLEAAEEIKGQAEEWRRRITYETQLGVVFKDKLKISPDGVEWKERRFPLDEITRVRWGGTRHSVNGVPTGTDYSIFVGSDSDSTIIKTKKAEVYGEFTDRLFKGVGIRLFTEMLQNLRDGNRIHFGSAIMDDSGMKFEKWKLFGDNEKIYGRWAELEIWNSAGTFCIGKKGDKKASVALSYQDDDNVHILEASIRMFWKKGGSRLSDVLQQE